MFLRVFLWNTYVSRDSLTGMRYALVPGFVGYRVGSDGSVWSRWLRGGRGWGLCSAWSRLRPSLMKRSGYLRVTVRGKTCKVHTWVLTAFRGPRPTSSHECRHKNGVRTDNRLRNLAWGTKLENASDKIRHGTCVRLVGRANPGVKLEEREVLELVAQVRAGVSMYVLARTARVSLTTIQKIMAGRAWAWLTGIAPRAPGKCQTGLEKSNAKLDAVQVRAIVRAVQAGALCKTQAALYGVSATVVQGIVRGERWSCVTGIRPACLPKHARAKFKS